MFDHDGKPRLLPWLLLITLLAGIFLLSTGAFSSEATERIFGLFNNLARKLAHFCEYAVLFIGMRWVLSTVARKRSNRVLSLAAFLLCALYAISDEWHQSFVPDRTPSAFDVLLDSCGAAFGWVVWSVCRRFRRPR